MSCHPVTLLYCLGKILKKIIRRRLTSLTADTIPKQQLAGRNGFSTSNPFAKLTSNAEISQI